MRDEERIPELLDSLKELWSGYYTDMRFGQLLINFIFVGESFIETEMWGQEDDITSERIKTVLEWVKKKRAREW